MAFDAGAVKGRLILDDSDWVKGAKGAGKANENMAKSMFNAQIAFAAFQQVLRATTGFLKDSVNAFVQQEKVEKQLESVLKSTSHAAGLAKEELLDMAKALQEVTTFGDEAIIGAQNIMLTFTQIGKETMPTAIETVLNMSQALGTDLKNQSIQLGKALNDPIKGVSALKEVGVSLTEAQGDLIRSMVEVGDVAGAQKVILQELEVEFGNSARAATETFGGKMQQMQNKFANIMERIGSKILPVVVEMLGNFTKWAEENEEGLIKVFENIAGAIKFIADAATVVMNVLKELSQAAQESDKELIKRFKAAGAHIEDLEKRFGKKVVSEALFEMQRDAALAVAQTGMSLEELKGFFDKSATDILQVLKNTKLAETLQKSIESGLSPEEIEQRTGIHISLIHGLIDTYDLLAKELEDVGSTGEDTGDSLIDSNNKIKESAVKSAEVIETVYTDVYTKLVDEFKNAVMEFGIESMQFEQAWINLFGSIASEIETYTGVFTEMFSSFQALSDTQLNNELIATQKDYDKKKALIMQSVTDEKERNKRLEKLEKEKNQKEAALKREQFKKNQRASIIEAVIATALAVVNALASSSPPMNFIMAALVGAAGAVEIAAIASQDTPAFQSGGIASPGVALVGEAGPELINVGTTSRIFPADETMRMMGSRGVNMNNTFTGDINTEQDIDQLMLLAGASVQSKMRGVV